ncbi:hypothetical protein BD413DRAFT_258345 [Trametes elegans]|nr:hypothetical protein BD413DRAFT_258345 [Trametes elegans]
MKLWLWSAPTELKKRFVEANSKLEAIFKDGLGDKRKDMYELRGLATDPAMQGRGYGSALVTTLIVMADAAGRGIWLLTTSAYTFYEPFGFRVVSSVVIGADNPKWDGEPVTARLMVRPANSADS